MTSDLGRCAFEHRTGALAGFTRQHGCKLLVWCEPHERTDEAIARENKSSPPAKGQARPDRTRQSALERSLRHLECVISRDRDHVVILLRRLGHRGGHSNLSRPPPPCISK